MKVGEFRPTQGEHAQVSALIMKDRSGKMAGIKCSNGLLRHPTLDIVR